jgi:hypothetical protein
VFNLFRYFEKKPIVVVSCLRDIHLLALQAQSIAAHLKGRHDIYILVNERNNLGEWNLQFDRYCKKWYSNHNVHIMYKKEFGCEWSRNGNPNYRGWEDQQILKLAIAERIKSESYFILDSQNFLIKKWSTRNYPVKFGKVPSRNSMFSMSTDTYSDYCSAFNVDPLHLDQPMMSISTPIFLKTSLVLSLINQHGGLKNFSKMFFNFKSHPSEFLMYFIWAEKQGGFYKHHYDVKEIWNGPMVRSGLDKWSWDNLFDKIGNKKENWISVTHSSWQDITSENKIKMIDLLKKYKLNVGESGL